MNFSLLRNFFEKINFNVGGRKNSNGNNIKINGNSNNIIDKIIHNNYYQKENKIELSEQALRIYEEFKKSNDRFLGISRDEKGIPEISLHPSGEVIENLDLRFVEGNIQELVNNGFLIKKNKDVYERVR